MKITFEIVGTLNLPKESVTVTSAGIVDLPELFYIDENGNRIRVNYSITEMRSEDDA